MKKLFVVLAGFVLMLGAAAFSAAQNDMKTMEGSHGMDMEEMNNTMDNEMMNNMEMNEEMAPVDHKMMAPAGQ